MAFIVTRINVGDYDAWKLMFDQDRPRAREKALGYRLLRSVDIPGEVFVEIEFRSVEDAREGRQRLIVSGVLDRFTDRSRTTVVELAEEK
jgi:hypothetical protein